MEPPSTTRFADVLNQDVLHLQESLTELCGSIGADLSVPYPLSKRLGIDKNLTWKAARILQAADASEALKHLPGKNGRELFLEGFRRAGAPEEAVRAVADAVGRLEATVQRHTDDKQTLELVLDGIPSQNGELLETSRRLAFRGNSGIWGVQARTRLTTMLLAPTADGSERLDLALVAGFLHFRRLREETPWPILKLRRIADGATSIPARGSEPLDPAGAFESGPSLLTAFSSTPPPTIRTLETRQHRVLELAEGPIGNPGAVDLVFGEVHRSFAPQWAEKPGELAEQQSDVDVPVEHLLFDLLVHEDLPLGHEPHFQLLGRLGRDLAPAGARRDADALPIDEKVQTLEPTVQALSTDLFPRYTELLGFVAQRCGWDLDRFRVHRVTVAHPPVPTTAVLSQVLPQRPEPRPRSEA